MHVETDAGWVPAAVAGDIPDGTVVPATLPTGPIAVWRSATGKLHANGDRCPHRGMRLSHGFVRGETLSCIYHGWRYGADGACEYIPAHPNVVPPKAINCGPLPVSERNGVVYVAPAQPTDEPIEFPGHHALRSLMIAASPARIIAAGQGTQGDGAVSVELAGTQALLLMTPNSPDEMFVIALVDHRLGVTDRLAMSSALETLRRAAETEQMVAE